MVQPSLTDNVDTVNLRVFQPAQSDKPANLAKHRIPERNGNIIQFMGTDSEIITLQCYVAALADLTQLKTWKDAGTNLTYNDDDHASLGVNIESLSVSEPVSVQANYREFLLVIVEN